MREIEGRRSEGERQEREDPLGLKDSWIKTISAIQKFTEWKQPEPCKCRGGNESIWNRRDRKNSRKGEENEKASGSWLGGNKSVEFGKGDRLLPS